MSSSNKSRRSINESNNEELNEKIYQKYLEINKKIIQYSNQFKENFESISQNDKILYENIMNLIRILSISLKFNSIIIVFWKGFKKKEPSAGQRFAFLNYRSLFLSGIKITRSL